MEIERKFLVKTLPNLTSLPFYRIRQAYISIEPVIRIRQLNETYFLTIKSKGHVSRQEQEIEITESEFTQLLSKKEGAIIEKNRYCIPIGSQLIAELDLFLGTLSPLITVEVEFKDEAICKSFVPPDWFGQDISYDSQYKNNCLAAHGLPDSFKNLSNK